MTEQKTSSLVTGLATTTLVFGIIGLLGSFIPCFGIYALLISVPFLILGVITIIIAKFSNAPRGLAVAATTLAGLATAIAIFQLFAMQETTRQLEELNTELHNQ